MTKKKIFLSGDLWVLDNVRLWNISFQGWHFPAFSRLYQQNFSCRQPLWRSLVNTSPISQFQENVSSFNFLANTLPMCNCGNGTETIINYFVHCTQVSIVNDKPYLIIKELLMRPFCQKLMITLSIPCYLVKKTMKTLFIKQLNIFFSLEHF